MRTLISLGLVCLVALAVIGCTIPEMGSSNVEGLTPEQSSIYGDWQSSTELAEEQIMRQRSSGTDSSGIARGTGTGTDVSSGASRGAQFRDTSEGEPAAIHQFVNTVLVDDEYVTITLQSKTADEYGDAGYTLKVENHYKWVTSVGRENYCYITPVLGSWTVDGKPLEPLAEGQVYPDSPGTIYLYFDEFTSIEELVNVKGTFEVYLISDWWNPVGVYEFNQE